MFLWQWPSLNIEEQHQGLDHATIYYAIVLPGRQPGFPGRVSAGCQSGKLQNRPSSRPSAGGRADFDGFPIKVQPKIRPGRPISGPEALLRNMG